MADVLPSELSNREIGERLYVSVNTVKTHVRSIYAKLRAQSRDRLVADREQYAARERILVRFDLALDEQLVLVLEGTRRGH